MVARAGKRRRLVWDTGAHSMLQSMRWDVDGTRDFSMIGVAGPDVNALLFAMIAALSAGKTPGCHPYTIVFE